MPLPYCPKHVEFYSKNKYEKLVLLVGFIIRIFHDARSSECQTQEVSLHYSCVLPYNANLLNPSDYFLYLRVWIL